MPPISVCFYGIISTCGSAILFSSARQVRALESSDCHNGLRSKRLTHPCSGVGWACLGWVSFERALVGAGAWRRRIWPAKRFFCAFSSRVEQGGVTAK